ncbi:hypothetical protein [Capnocytophaga catalasegens]|uniref:Uncharacterized protein n=1 Tax=Capnocytophaga catalasegens TaxID=1004260 RepID=A0AAV5AV89_9FLAO|nr:hypothetical protein [Capnocytophaga catalasegens]GIZ14973.1 hypothetical protein RCZ03_09730 [Capnocytophaga catalasegens]GJM49352.1 hypothetical protein RCZ15_03270 [Capnocytophaga catalasegens]GJM52503.1 hypothetical protein RCZ16_08200 [Capnocytophaga catalasegens]
MNEVILYLLKEAKFDRKSLFLSTRVDFGSQKFRKILADKQIITNIKQNPRNDKNKVLTLIEIYMKIVLK